MIGGLAGDAITDAHYNTAVGYESLSLNQLGSKNVAIGYSTLATMNPASASNTFNTAVGHAAGQLMQNAQFWGAGGALYRGLKVRMMITSCL